jgi:hypothetical protein
MIILIGVINIGNFIIHCTIDMLILLANIYIYNNISIYIYSINVFLGQDESLPKHVNTSCNEHFCGLIGTPQLTHGETKHLLD